MIYDYSDNIRILFFIYLKFKNLKIYYVFCARKILYSGKNVMLYNYIKRMRINYVWKTIKNNNLYLYKNDRIFIRTLLGDVYILLNV